MSINILDTVKQYLTPDLITKASSMLGENETAVSKALSGVVPSVFSGLISKASSGGTSGANDILNMAKDSHSSGLLGNIGNIFSDGGLLNKGAGLLQGLFGDKLNGIISSIASFAGIKNSSASSLFSMAAPVATATVGKYAVENNLNAGGLSSFLASQKANVMNMLPAGLSGITSLLGLGKISDGISSVTSNARQSATSTANYVSDRVEEKTGGMKWLLWLLLLALAALAAWYFLFGGKSGCSNSKPATSDTTVMTTIPADTATTVTTTTSSREFMKVRLPNGSELDAYKGGIEDQLVNFLGTNWARLGADSLKKVWFDFDDLNFKTGSADITDESQRQLNNIIAILKAFPKAKIKIGGYTDKTGNEETNKKLSASRAEAVKTALTKAGLSGQVDGAEGYGSAFAKFAADAPESDRVKDRHVSVSVRE